MKLFLIHKKRISVLVFLILFSLQKSHSQQENFWSNVRFGGNIGIGFTGDTFNGVIAPSAIYDFSNQFSAGVGLHFGYTDSGNFTAVNYGASLITLYNPFPSLQLSAEFEQMAINSSFEIEGGRDINDNYTYPALFIGAGYRVGFVSVGLRYDVLYDENTSIYASAYAPFVRVFF